MKPVLTEVYDEALQPLMDQEIELTEAYDRAYNTDPESAFGGIIAFNQALDAETAAAISLFALSSAGRASTICCTDSMSPTASSW